MESMGTEVMERGTLTMEEAARRLGIGRGAAYAAAREGRLPVPVIRIGRKMLVSRAAVEALLAAPQSNPE
jgi:excisionase family DNA binding protein